MISPNIKYSIKSIYKRKLRSFLTIISILIGITTIFIFLSFGLGLYQYVNSFLTESSADKVTISPKGIGIPGMDDTFALTEKDLREVKKASGVYEATGVSYKVAEIRNRGEKKYTFLIAEDPEDSIVKEFTNVKILKGRDLMKSDQGNVVLGYNYLIDNKIFSKALDLNDVIEIDNKSLRVVGFYGPIGNPADDAQIYVNSNYLNQLYPGSETSYGMIIARVDITSMDTTIENIEKNLRNFRGLEKGEEDFYVASFKDLLEQYTVVLNSVVGFIILIALISVLVSAINTSNTMITSVLERVKEIGTMKAIGARNSEIFKIFLFESAILGLIAGVVGVLLGFLLVLLGENILTQLGYGFLKPAYPWYLFVGCILFSLLTGSFAGLIPAINASKKNPVESLRYE